MSTVTQIQREVALLVEREPRSVLIIATQREVAQLGDSVLVTPFANAREVAQLNDNVAQSAYTAVRDVAELADSATNSVLQTAVEREVALFKSRGLESVRVFTNVREGAVLNDAAVGTAAALLRDVAQLNDAATPATTAARNAREVAKLGDAARPYVGITAREIALLNDSTQIQVGSVAIVREVSQLGDRVSVLVQHGNLLRDVAVVSERATPVLVYRPLLREKAYVSDVATPPPYGRAYTCSIMTWGMSTFSNFPFHTMAGKYAAGENLWSLTGTRDNGRDISSHIKTGMLDMSAEQKKRMSAVYVSGSSESPLTVSISGDVGGTRMTYDYSVLPTEMDDYRNGRAVVGKGFHSRFIQVKIGAVNVNYRLLSASADVAVSMRRV